MEHIIIPLLTFLIGTTLGFLYKRKPVSGEAISRQQYEEIIKENTTLAVQFQTASTENKSLKEALEKGRDDLAQAREKVVQLETKKEAFEHQLVEQRQEFKNLQEQLKLEFKNTATAIFEEISTKFSTQSEKKIGDLLAPMRERLGEFNKKVEDSFGVQAKEQHTLKAEIERIVNMNEQMRLQTDGLTKALRGDVKAQGNWGEVILERILEESGLRKDEDYILQGADMGLSGTEGNRLKPDVVVRLPDNKHVIIDSKVSLVPYERYSSETDENLKHAELREFLKSVKNHVNVLEQKCYQDIDKLGTPDFVLMFMPVEGSYSLAIQQDRELHTYAWGKRIVIVCPSTLFATLRTIASIWRIELQNKHAQEIAVEGGKLYDKFISFLEDMQSMNKQMGSLQKSYDQAMNKLRTGRGNLIDKVEKLKQLGAKATKSLPKEMRSDAATEDNIAIIADETSSEAA